VKRIMFSLLVFALFGAPQADAPLPPLSLAIVPTHCFGEDCIIMMGDEKPLEFYVVLTNNSRQNQPVYEDWSSWGFQTISFELTTAEGKKYVISKRDHNFDVNRPTSFLIKPGQHQVFAIRFDDDWETNPAPLWKAEMRVTLKAIYEVPSSYGTFGDIVFPATVKEKVWKGRIESPGYAITLVQTRYAGLGDTR
jgi:hypothetical protein